MSKLRLDDIEETTPKTEKPKEETIEIVPDGFFKIEGLPSKGKLYPEGTKIYSRPLKILEVKQLSAINEENFNEVINSVLSKSVLGINIEDLLVADKLFIIFWQRANTYKGDAFAIDYTCNHCGKDDQYNFDVGHLNLSELKDDWESDIKLPSGKEIKLNQLTVKSERQAEAFLKQNPTADPDIVGISAVVEKIDNEEVTIKQAYDKIVELSPPDVLNLIAQYQDGEVNLAPTLHIHCNNCGGQAETPVSFHGSFFLPEYRS